MLVDCLCSMWLYVIAVGLYVCLELLSGWNLVMESNQQSTNVHQRDPIW